MAYSPKISVALADLFLDGIGSAADGANLCLYANTQPATPETAAGATAIATCVMNATAFNAAASHQIAAKAITDDTNTVGGTAAWFRLWNAGGTEGLLDGSVGTSGCDMNLNSVTLSAGGTLHISSFIVNLPVA
jgi:hypothetical protein